MKTVLFQTDYVPLQLLIDALRATDCGPIAQHALDALDAQAVADANDGAVQDAIATARFASDDEHEVDEISPPLTSKGDDGVWVQTWVWYPNIEENGT